MFHEAKSDEFRKLASHPGASIVTGESGLQYLALPETALNPAAKPHICPLDQVERHKDVLVAPVYEDGTRFSAPYEG